MSTARAGPGRTRHPVVDLAVAGVEGAHHVDQVLVGEPEVLGQQFPHRLGQEEEPVEPLLHVIESVSLAALEIVGGHPILLNATPDLLDSHLVVQVPVRHARNLLPIGSLVDG